MIFTTPEEREAKIEEIKGALIDALAKYKDDDCSREIIYALSGVTRKVTPCPNLDNWPKFVDGAFYLETR